MDPFSIALGLGGMAYGAVSESQARKKKEDQINKILAELRASQYDQNEITSGVDKVGDQFNTQIADQMNSSAIGVGNLINRDTFKAITASKLLGQRASAMAEQRNKMVDYNQKASLQIAQIGSETPSYDATPMIAGGIAGYGMGEAVSKLTGIDSFDKLFRTGEAPKLNDYTPDVNKVTMQDSSSLYNDAIGSSNLLNQASEKDISQLSVPTVNQSLKKKKKTVGGVTNITFPTNAFTL